MGIKDIRPYDADSDKTNRTHRESGRSRISKRPPIVHKSDLDDWVKKQYVGIDNVTTSNLNMALRMCGIEIHISILDKILDVVRLLEIKGNDASILDIEVLKSEWSVQGLQELIANEQKK